jgi:predicted TPR repeat methyltransferase
MSLEELKSQEDSFRTFLASKPQNAKILSKLSSTLLERSKIESLEALRDEAIDLAARAIEVAPSKPYGYAMMSVAARTWSERKEALVQAIDRSSETFRIARIGLLVRLLTEQRDVESRSKTKNFGTAASLSQPSRRNLTATETQIYDRISNDLDAAWNIVEPYSAAEQEFLSKQEFRLGLFFRKKLPSTTNVPRARKHLEQSRRWKNNDEMVAFWLATMDENDHGNSVIDRCPADYVVKLYSSFASRFDELLVEKLEYQTPRKLRQLLDECNQKDLFHTACDLGCGTGLSGIAFKDRVKGSLVGLDLSPAMLEKARARGCYSHLRVDDIDTGLAKFGLEFDLVIACDVFCYIGDLSYVFQAVAHSLSAGGCFCFSVELLKGDTTSPFLLHECARFSHQQFYVEKLAANAGLDIEGLLSTCIRKNQGKEVLGLLAILRKP